jgi:DNA segregation ATPase FtsK/SpoIIIE, S-DNA-T family
MNMTKSKKARGPSSNSAGIGHPTSLPQKSDVYRLPDGSLLDPIPVPNPRVRRVTLREMVQDRAWLTNKMALSVALGKEVGGGPIIFDLASAPHILVAGAPGSGKSVCLEAILAGLLLSRRPDEVKLLLVNPNQAAFSIYANLPHLLAPVVTDVQKAQTMLLWAIKESNRRHKLLKAAHVQNIDEFNNRDDAQPSKPALSRGAGSGRKTAIPVKLPYIVIIIDEVADLLTTAGHTIEQSITQLAQLSKAVGIHMILATQPPAKDVLIRAIMANIPTRLAFQVVRKADSRTILDQEGSESLLGRGDMLFMCPEQRGPLLRIQGVWVSAEETLRITDFVRRQSEPAFDKSLEDLGKSGSVISFPTVA